MNTVHHYTKHQASAGQVVVPTRQHTEPPPLPYTVIQAVSHRDMAQGPHQELPMEELVGHLRTVPVVLRRPMEAEVGHTVVVALEEHQMGLEEEEEVLRMDLHQKLLHYTVGPQRIQDMRVRQAVGMVPPHPVALVLEVPVVPRQAQGTVAAHFMVGNREIQTEKESVLFAQTEKESVLFALWRALPR